MQSKEPFSIKRFFGKKSNIFLLIEGIFFRVVHFLVPDLPQPQSIRGRPIQRRPW